MEPISRRQFVHLAGGSAASLLLLSKGSSFAQSAPVLPTSGPDSLWLPRDASNTPIGTARGIFPGRVTFIRDARAAKWDGMTGRWWDEGNIDESALAEMISKSLKSVTGASTDSGAWKKLFTHFNEKQGRGSRGYQPGESIAVKLNFNCTHKYEAADNSIDQSPQATRALLRQLTAEGGIAQKDIVLYDAMRFIPDRIYDPLHAEFPEVRWMDGKGLKGREAAQWTPEAITYSSSETALGNELPKAVVDATYLINVALFKGHEMSGVTLCGKNHFGSIRVPSKDHPKYVTPMNRPADAYSAYVDLMGCPNLGGKTMLYIVDGLYGMMTNVGAPKPERDRWKTHFNGEWSSCYFMSLDPVAIDSVCLDFLRTECPRDLGFSGNPHFALGSIKNCDNYLHDAAAGTNAQLGEYKPNGVAIGSQGVHEHWNNAKDRQYSRNLGPDGKGIELFTI